MLDTLKNLHPVVGTVVSFAEFAVLERTDKFIALVAIAVIAKECFSQIKAAWDAAREKTPFIAGKPATTKQVPDMEADGTTAKLAADGKTPLMKTVEDEPKGADIQATYKAIFSEMDKTAFFKAAMKPLTGMTVSLAALAVVVLK